MERYSVRSIEAIPGALGNHRSVAELKETIAKSAESGTSRAPRLMPKDRSLVAGTSLDLSGRADLWIAEGKKRQLDTLLKRVWHYFDDVVVAGPSAVEMKLLLDKDEQRFLEHIAADIELFQYIDEIGGRELLVFVDKPLLGSDYSPEFVRQARPVINVLAEKLANESTITWSDHDDHMHFVLNHPMLEHTQWGSIGKQHASDAHSSKEHAAAWQVLGPFLQCLVTDISLAHELSLPLGSTVALHGEILREMDSEVSGGDVAFNIELPVIDGLSITALLQLRQDENDSFELFRGALRSAVNERVAAIDLGRDARGLAKEIERDVINPELRRIRLKMDTTRKRLRRNSGLAVVAGGLITSCGIAGGSGFFDAGATVAVSGVAAAIRQASDAALNIKSHDMYFLWKALSVR